MTSIEKLEQRVHYSIMPDYGGAYGWINRKGTDDLGPNHACFCGWNGDHPISDELHNDFVVWQTEFEQAENHWSNAYLLLDWGKYHERGIQLTRRLKTEIGDAARVFYVKPYEDPNTFLYERYEVLLDGSLIERHWRRPHIYMEYGWLSDSVISSGQTGAERAALHWACSHRIPHGGWCPKGRLAADGPIPICYQLRETESSGHRECAELNVGASDATLIFNVGELDGETLEALRFAKTIGKPHRVLQLDQVNLEDVALQVIEWLKLGQLTALYITGPREEEHPGIYAIVASVLNLCMTNPQTNPQTEASSERKD